MSLPFPANPQVQKFLLQVAQAEGPLRLFKPRSSSTPGSEGLLSVSRGPEVQIVVRLLGTYLEELPRAPRQARLLRLSSLGVRALVESTPPARRSALVRQSSPLYRDRLLRAWKELASSSESPDFQKCFAEHYGDLAPQPTPGAAAAPDASVFLRAMAKELVLSWERTRDPEGRRGLARAMLSLGLREVGQAGERTQFTGRLHLSEEPLFHGDPVEIVEPGWTVSDHQGEFLLRKAQVKSITDHA